RTKNKDQKTKNKDQRPKTKDQRPKTKDQRPKAKGQRPKTKDQRPKTKDQRPKTKDQRPKNSTKGNCIMNTVIKDIRYAFRSLIKRPGFAVIGVLSLALGIGANTAIFSLVNTVLLRSLPVANPEQVVAVNLRGKGDSFSAFSYPNYKDFRDRNDVLSGLAAYRFISLSMSRSGNNERVWGYLVSGNYFDVLGVNAIKGRTFQPEEDQARSANPVVVISYECWQRRFGGDSNIVGTDVLLNNNPFKFF